MQTQTQTHTHSTHFANHGCSPRAGQRINSSRPCHCGSHAAADSHSPSAAQVPCAPAASGTGTRPTTRCRGRGSRARRRQAGSAATVRSAFHLLSSPFCCPLQVPFTAVRRLSAVMSLSGHCPSIVQSTELLLHRPPPSPSRCTRVSSASNELRVRVGAGCTGTKAGGKGWGAGATLTESGTPLNARQRSLVPLE